MVHDTYVFGLTLRKEIDCGRVVVVNIRPMITRRVIDRVNSLGYVYFSAGDRVFMGRKGYMFLAQEINEAIRRRALEIARQSCSGAGGEIDEIYVTVDLDQELEKRIREAIETYTELELHRIYDAAMRNIALFSKDAGDTILRAIDELRAADDPEDAKIMFIERLVKIIDEDRIAVINNLVKRVNDLSNALSNMVRECQ